MSARALLLVAHGSRRAPANREVAALARRLRAAAAGRWDRVAHAFLELAEPDVPTALADCVAAGAGEVVLVPYFLAAGRHVREDIPRLVKQARARHPGVRIEARAHTGAGDGLVAVLLRQAAGASPV